ncbi:MAG: Asp-tRNA(Asn)/Glu-tRNA(Gln) amidotransferase subunit GatC [Deinococcota bacterium]
MSITTEEMEHLKRLARLELSEEETEHLKGDINKTLDYFTLLNELDTDGVEELVRPVQSVNVFRADEVVPTLTHEDAMSVAVEQEDGFYKVPRTVDTGE